MHQIKHTEELRAAGLKATPGRKALLHSLEGARKPLSAHELAGKLSLNVVSVYRALESLVAAGLVRQGSDGQTWRFSYSRRPHHHHMICADCGFSLACPVC